jgi:hypothetical protein
MNLRRQLAQLQAKLQCQIHGKALLCPVCEGLKTRDEFADMTEDVRMDRIIAILDKAAARRDADLAANFTPSQRAEVLRDQANMALEQWKQLDAKALVAERDAYGPEYATPQALPPAQISCNGNGQAPVSAALTRERIVEALQASPELLNAALGDSDSRSREIVDPEPI